MATTATARPRANRQPATRETAEQAYGRRQSEARALLGQITALLDQHATKQAAQPLNWGFAGDLAEVVSQLSNTRAMLAGEDY